MSSWFASGNKSTSGVGGGGGGGGDDRKGKQQQSKKSSSNTQQFPVVVELDEQVLLQDFVIPKKKSSSSNKTAASHHDDDNTSSSTPLLIGSIDQGTSSTRFLVFCSTTGKICCSAQMEHTQIIYINQNDKVGWHEHDPMEIYKNTITCIQAVQDKFRTCQYANYIFSNSTETSTTSGGGGGGSSGSGTGGKNAPTLAAVGLTNQRETTIAWNKVRMNKCLFFLLL
jgi:FGGY family of carbohydrate kinases, N-terminal domain